MADSIVTLRSDPRFIDLTGHKYGALTVIKYAGRSGKYLAQIDVNKSRIYLGVFPDAVGAHNARIEAEAKHWHS